MLASSSGLRLLHAARRHWRKIGVVSALVLSVALAVLPTTTRAGIDYVVYVETEPLYAKAVSFVARDVQMRAVASKAAAGAATDEERALLLLEWTHLNVQPQPSHLRVIDDHPYHIVVRGYGTHDQAADVFATLAAYMGIPATTLFARPTGGGAYAFAVALIDGDWRLFDPREDRAFRDREGHLATLTELRADPALTAALPPPLESGTAYPTLIAALPRVPSRLRPYDQMLLRRPFQELFRDR